MKGVDKSIQQTATTFQPLLPVPRTWGRDAWDNTFVTGYIYFYLLSYQQTHRKKIERERGACSGFDKF